MTQCQRTAQSAVNVATRDVVETRAEEPELSLNL